MCTWILKCVPLLCLLGGTLCAPVEYSGEAGLTADDLSFRTALRLGQSLANKVLQEIPAVHRSCITNEAFTLQATEDRKNLHYLEKSLGIPSAPVLTALSADFTIDTCLNHMSEGLHMYRFLLSAICKCVQSQEPAAELQADLRDLLGQIEKMREQRQLEKLHYKVPTLSPITTDYEVQRASHLTLVGLQNFAQDIQRSIRNILTQIKLRLQAG